MITPASDTAADAPAPAGSPAYKRYMLVVLLVVLAFNYVDRLALGLLLQDIKLDLQLSDTQLGVLTGIAFAIFYSLAGIPIARWADRGNRVTIITVTTLLWSVFVALCGAAASFVQLLAIRVGVAVGEAGCVPPAHSLIADTFARAERPRAVSVYMLGGPLSLLVGYFAAGWLNEAVGWRMTFLILGIPGIAVALLAWFTLREPRAAPLAPHGPAVGAAPPPTFVHIARHMAGCASFRHLLLGFSVLSFFNNGIGQWQPAFFIRSHGMQTGELGTWFALIYGLCGLAGTWIGGGLATRLAAERERLQLRWVALAVASFGILTIFIYLSSSLVVAFGIMGIAVLAGAMISGPLFATIQTLVPTEMRAVAIALVYLFANLIGMGLGPLAVGILSDLLAPRAGAESLRYALALLSPGYLWGAWHLWRASNSVMADLAAVGAGRKAGA